MMAVVEQPARAAPPPTFEPMSLRLPDDMILGEISAVAIDRRDNLWILHRPRTVVAADRSRAAPAVVAFDKRGRFLRAFGGPGDGYDWPTVEHSLHVDGKDRVWVAGNYRADPARADDMVLAFSDTGRFLRQIGRRGASTGNTDRGNVHAPGDLTVDDRTGDLYVADGYGNRRIVVFDAETGAFRRMWGAFGAPPVDGPAPALRAAGVPVPAETGEGPRNFFSVHGVEVAQDGTVYVADRDNQRVQAFTAAGRYLGQTFADRNMASPQTASGLAFSPDRAQRMLYVSDFGNARLLVFDRRSLRLIAARGERGTGPGQLAGPHLIAADSQGTLYVAEPQARRVVRLRTR